MINSVIISRNARKDLKKIPQYIANKLAVWVRSVSNTSLEEVRKLPAYHDEPLKGKRKGQRSIRLSNAYRAIYVIKMDGSVEFVSVEEVNKHDY